MTSSNISQKFIGVFMFLFGCLLFSTSASGQTNGTTQPQIKQNRVQTLYRMGPAPSQNATNIVLTNSSVGTDSGPISRPAQVRFYSLDASTFSDAATQYLLSLDFPFPSNSQPVKEQSADYLEALRDWINIHATEMDDIQSTFYNLNQTN